MTTRTRKKNATRDPPRRERARRPGREKGSYSLRTTPNVDDESTTSDGKKKKRKGGRSIRARTSTRAVARRTSLHAGSAMQYFTPQEMAGGVRYGSGCKVGNWNENAVVDEVGMGLLERDRNCATSQHEDRPRMVQNLAKEPLTPPP